MRLPFSFVPARVAWPDRKDAKDGILASSAHASTHLIPEARPFPGQRLALFKQAPGVFVHGAGRFALRPMPPAC